MGLCLGPGTINITLFLRISYYSLIIRLQLSAIMYSKSLILLTSGAALVAGITPAGFTPASNTDLMVVYGQIAATNGAVVDRACEFPFFSEEIVVEYLGADPN